MRWILNVAQSAWRALNTPLGAPRERNRPSPPPLPRMRITQDQVGEWKKQVALSVRFRDGDAKRLDLSGSALRGGDFTNCDLRDANLSRCDFKDANFERAELWNADFSGSDLTGAINLLPVQLAATNLKGTQLPDPLTKFDALETSAKLADNASKVFLVMLGAVAFTFLTLATAKDWQLITNNGNSKLPVIGVDVAIRDFCWAIPIVLLALFIYFHIYLQRLWEALATLPAVFPDGRRLDERSNPWLVADLMRKHLRWVQSQPVALSGLQYALSMTLGYWVMPVTVLALLGRLLFLHNWWVTGSQLLMLAFGTGLGFHFLANRWKTFKDQPEKLRGFPRVFHWLSADGGVYGGAAGAIFGLGFIWAGFSEAQGDLHGVDLHGAYLRAADFVHANLVGAHLEDAHLDDANFSHAFLDDAHFAGAHLDGAYLEEVFAEKADFRQTSFRGAHLEDAVLTYAVLLDAHLEKARLAGAHLRLAELGEAHLNGADLRHADLQGANLGGADLEGAMVSNLNQLEGAKGPYKGKVVVNPKDD
jgi:uncharacterized protein YjbI with pentapeptide repeats